MKRPEENSGDKPANATDNPSRVSQAPTPITQISGGGGYNPPPNPVPLQTPELPAHYPNFLKVQTRFVCGEAIKHKDRTHAIDAGCDIVRKLTTDFVQAVRENELRADLALSNMEALVEQFAYVNSDRNGRVTLNDGREIALQEAIKNSEAWREFNRAIIAARRLEAISAEAASPTFPVIVGNSGKTLDAKDGLTPAEVAPQTDRKAWVDAYIAEVLSVTGKKITRANIWKRAGYTSRTVFQCWQRNDPKRPNKAADERFTQILTDKPHLKVPRS